MEWAYEEQGVADGDRKRPELSEEGGRHHIPYSSLDGPAAASHVILARWRNYFSQLFDVHGVKNVGQAEIHISEPLVPEPSASEFQLAIDKLKSLKSPGIDQIPAALIKAGGTTIYLEFHKLIISIW